MKINLTLKEILSVVKGTCSLDHTFLIKNIASIKNAENTDLAIVFDRGNRSVFDTVDMSLIKQSSAGVILAATQLCQDKDFIIVADPLDAYVSLVHYCKERDKSGTDLLSSGAVIDQSVVLGDHVCVGHGAVISNGTSIGSNSHIHEQTFIGVDCTIGSGVILYPGVRILDRTCIGNNVVIHANTVIGSDGYGYQVTSTGLKKIPQIGSVSIGSNVEIGANVTIDRASFDMTIISDGVKIDNLVHIAHGVTIGPHTAIIAQTGIAGGTKVGAGCQIGGQVAIKDHLTIGDRVKIVSKSAVLKNIASGQTVAGVPSMLFSDWKRMMVHQMRLPIMTKHVQDRFKNIEKKLLPWWKRFFLRGHNG